MSDERRPLVRLNLVIAFFSLVGVATVAVVDGGRTSPGTLSSVHGQLEELQGRMGCAECHGGWFSSMSKACLDCHAPIAEQMDVGTGLHGRLGADAARCAACHSDHHGEAFDLIGRHSFVRAGVPDPEAFDHALIGFEMSGKHTELACTECHENAEVKVLTPGTFRFLGLVQSCASCHDDPHEGLLGSSCSDCHTQTSFDEHIAIGHDEHLPLLGGHAALDCRSCHAAGEPHALEVLLGSLRKPDARGCIDCHDSPHAKEFLRGTARLARLAPDASCQSCHAHEHETFRDERLELTRAQHATSGFALVAPHAELACAQCHDPAEASFAARHPGRSADSCAACHEDPHAGQFDDGPFAAQGCIACHAREAFDPHHFDVDMHARTGFALMESHLAADCPEIRELDVNPLLCYSDRVVAVDLRVTVGG